MDIDVLIAEAQLELDSADDRASFEAAVRRQIDAYRAYAELLEGRARHGSEGVLGQWDGDGDSIRHRTAATAQRLERYRELSNEVSHSLKASVLAALDDLDRAAARARSTRGGSTNGRGATWE
jgi:hypothetical protein